MKLTILEVGDVPPDLQAKFTSYPKMFVDLFEEIDAQFDFEIIAVHREEELPHLSEVEAVLIPGSAAGVYEDHTWLEPLRAFIRAAYAANVPMLGVCFGHQIIADALGGDVRKSEKGWGLGHHTYRLSERTDVLSGLPDQISILASHQDQVISPPQSARVFLASDFTPNAGLLYDNGCVLTVQPHPEFKPDYSQALAEHRLDKPLTPAEVDAVKRGVKNPLDSIAFAKAMVRFLTSAA